MADKQKEREGVLHEAGAFGDDSGPKQETKKNYVQVFYAHVKLFHTFIVTSFFIIFGILTLCTMPPKSNISSFPISKFTDTKSGWLRTFFQQLQLSGAVLRHVSVVYS